MTTNIGSTNKVGSNTVLPKTLVYTFSHSYQAEQCHDPQVIGSSYAERYYHIRTPLQKADLVMFRFDLEGYAYGASQPLDITWCGYNYENKEYIHQSNINRNSGQTINNISQYYQGNNLVLKFGPINRYCNSFCLYYQGHYHSA